MAKAKSSENESKNFAKARKHINKIVKNLNRNDLGWVLQISVNSFQPDKIKYCAEIEAPANGLQPLTWIKDSMEDLEKALEKAEKELNQKEVDKAYYASEAKRAGDKKAFFEEKLLEISQES